MAVHPQRAIVYVIYPLLAYHIRGFYPEDLWTRVPLAFPKHGANMCRAAYSINQISIGQNTKLTWPLESMEPARRSHAGTLVSDQAVGP